MFRKLRILLAEIIGFGVLLGWLMWKYPELVDEIIPWVALLIAWHLTWEYALDTEVVKRGAAILGRKVKPMVAWPLVFIIGGGVSLLYWKGINKSINKLTSLQAARQHHSETAATEQATAHPATNNTNGDFDVTPDIVINGTVVYGLGLWVVNRPKAIYPVGIAMFLRLRNKASIANMVDSLRLDIKTQQGTWEELPEIVGGHPYQGSRENAWRINIPFLRNGLKDRNIQPGDYVPGWMLFDYPKSATITPPNWRDYSRNSMRPKWRAIPGDKFVLVNGYPRWVTVPPFTSEFRATVTNMQGVTSVVVFGPPQNVHWSEQEVAIEIAEKSKNISQIPVKFFREY